MQVKESKIVQGLGKGITKGLFAIGRGTAHVAYFLGKNIGKGIHYGIKEIKEEKKKAKMGLDQVHQEIEP